MIKKNCVMLSLLCLFLTSVAFGDENITANLPSLIGLQENTSVNAPINFTNYMNVSASVTISGNAARFILPAPFDIQPRTFLPKYTIVIGTAIGTYNESLNVSYSSAIANSSFLLPTQIFVFNSTMINATTNQTGNETTNQTNQTINATLPCQENCSIVINIVQPPQNATYIRVRDVQGLMNVTGDFNNYTCTKVLDDVPESLDTVPNNTEQPFVILGLIYEVPHTLYIRCRAGDFINNSELVTFKSTLSTNATGINGTIINGTIIGNITTPVITTGLTPEQIQGLVDSILESKTKELQDELNLKNQLQDFSCLYSEDRVQQMNDQYNQLSDFAKQCLPAFIDANFTNYQFFASQCPFLNGDYQTAGFILNEYYISGFAKKQTIVQQIQYSAVVKGGQTQVFSQPQSLYYYYPYQITNGCIHKFQQIEEIKKQEFSSGYSEGLLITVIMILGILAFWWYSANKG